LTFCKKRSVAKAPPSLEAMASIISGSDIPSTTKAEAPKKVPIESRATAAIEPIPPFFEIAASTLIFAMPGGGGIHRELLLILVCSFLSFGAVVISKSAI
jgi:hypothetical protein